jgi:predicted dehydrogenase
MRQKKAVTRRTFLRAATAAVLGPAIIPASARGANGFTAPSNRIVVGLIGVGKQMRGHHRTMLRRNDVQVLALCDVESVRLGREENTNNEAYGERYGKDSYKACMTFNDFRDVCRRDDIDAVMVATPNHWHSIPCIEAMRHGKDVYCEKPLARTIHEGKVMRDTARKYARVFQTGSQQRSESGFRIACELVRNGHIGRVHTVHVNVGGPPKDCYLPAEPTPPGLDWDFWLGPAPYRPYHSDIAPDVDWDGWPNWRNYRDYAGGMMTDWGAHHFDIAQWGLGMDDSGPVEILPPDGTLERLTYIYANGVVMKHGGGEPSRAGVVFRGDKGKVMVNRGYLETDPQSLKNAPLRPGDTALYESPGHHEDWLNCIRTRRRPICDVEIGHRSATVCHIGNIAYWLKRPLKWDPVKEEFINDAEANRLLMRPMRSPWIL